MTIKNKAVFDKEDLANAIKVARSIKEQADAVLALLLQDEIDVVTLDDWRVDMRDVSDEAGMLSYYIDRLTTPYRNEISIDSLIEHRANLIAEGVHLQAIEYCTKEIAKLQAE
jgi:hypothetical protein